MLSQSQSLGEYLEYLKFFPRPELGNENSYQPKALCEYIPAKGHLQTIKTFELKFRTTSLSKSKVNKEN